MIKVEQANFTCDTNYSTLFKTLLAIELKSIKMYL